MLDVRKLTLLREVSLHAGITGAARALGLSVSSVSQQVSRLEAETGVLLLEAAGRGVRLTAHAEVLVKHTERILEILEEAETEITGNQDGLTGVVRLVAFHAFALQLLPLTIVQLQKLAPGLSLEFVQLDPDDAIRELGTRRADIAVSDEYPGLPLPPTQGLVQSELGRDDIDLYTPTPMNLKDLTQDERAKALASLPWVMEPRQSDSFRWTRNVCRSLGFEPKVAFESPNLDVHRMLVSAGAAAAFLPHSIAGDLATSSGKDLGLTDALYRTLSVLTRRGTEHSPAIGACKQAIMAAYLELKDGSALPFSKPASIGAN